jgi:shikimate dehydrogenase
MAKKFGLLGYPLGHSFSKPYFEKKFKELNLDDHSFVLFEFEKLEDFITQLEKEKELVGFSVTIPHKENIISVLDKLDTTAEKIGAVNCVKVNYEGGKKIMTGYNTDAYGFQKSIKPFLEPHHERALILGTGGAAKAIHYVLKNIGIDVWYVTRDKKRFSSATGYFEYEELNEHVMNSFKLIVNTTPTEMLYGEKEFPKIPYEYITPKHFCYDVIYKPHETEFLKKSKAGGAITMNGLDMLYGQAEKAWEIWNGK